MRLRNITGSRELIAESEYVIHDATAHKGRWNQVFGNENPIHIEVGMGKGKFITQLAEQNPGINYIGIEKYSSVLLRAVEKRQEYDGSKDVYKRQIYKALSVVVCLSIIAILLLTVSFLPPFGNPDNPANNEVTERYIESGLQETGAKMCIRDRFCGD